MLPLEQQTPANMTRKTAPVHRTRAVFLLHEQQNKFSVEFLGILPFSLIICSSILK